MTQKRKDIANDTPSWIVWSECLIPGTKTFVYFKWWHSNEIWFLSKMYHESKETY